MDSIDESSTYIDSDEVPISINTIEYIQDGNYAHLDINTRDARFKTCYYIRQAKSEWKGAEISSNRMGKVLHKVFKAVVN